MKKLLIADSLAPHVDRLFARHDALGVVSGWAAALGYSLQLYFDFSGYSDMAVGLACLLGFRFPQNFNSPFKAREHLRLLAALAHDAVGWLRDYLFIPLGGSPGAGADAPQPAIDDAARRAVARRRLDVRRLGAATTALLLAGHGVAKSGASRRASVVAQPGAHLRRVVAAS